MSNPNNPLAPEGPDVLEMLAQPVNPTPDTQARPTTLDEFFNLSLLDWEDDYDLEVIEAMRRQRREWDAEQNTAKVQGRSAKRVSAKKATAKSAPAKTPKASGSSVNLDVDDLLGDLGL